MGVKAFRKWNVRRVAKLMKNNPFKNNKLNIDDEKR